MEFYLRDKDPTFTDKIRTLLFGMPKEIKDPSLFHKMALIPVLAWIGLGADGLSSSAYGPEEAFRAIGSHGYLALFLALATAITVAVISYTYSRIIEHFPSGGGGYIVATHMLGKNAGVVSASALLVDYVLTITVSIASCTDAVFSFLPLHYHFLKVPVSCFLILALMILNIRGLKESIMVLTPIFLLFVLTHIFMLCGGFFSNMTSVCPLAQDVWSGFSHDFATIGLLGILAIFLNAYSLGGGTYTGIEAVSNGLQNLREPRVSSGKRTMLYMAVSLALTAGMLFICYLLFKVRPVEGRTLNAVLADMVYGGWPLGGCIAFLTIFSEGALLLVAAQAGFVDGPRVMANLAIDSWFPRSFASLSERLTMRNGIVLMGAAAIAVLLYTRGSVSALLVIYSINVFLTFTLSELGMSRYSLKYRHKDPKWKRHLALYLVGLAMCATILFITIVAKFREGGWMTLLITSGVIALCYLISGHYRKVRASVVELDHLLKALPASGTPVLEPPNPHDNTAIQLVSSYSGFGVHTLLSLLKAFPNTYKNIVFVSVALVDSGSFKGAEEIKALEEATKKSLAEYVDLARRFGLRADYRFVIGTDVVESAVLLCHAIAREYPHTTVFTGQICFRVEKFFHRFLHNETAYAVQRRLQWSGIPTVIMPIPIKEKNL